MSVLLEALKKAAESKQQDEVTEKGQDLLSDSEPSVSKNNDTEVNDVELSKPEDELQEASQEESIENSIPEQPYYHGLQLLGDDEKQLESEPLFRDIEEIELSQVQEESSENDEYIAVDQNNKATDADITLPLKDLGDEDSSNLSLLNQVDTHESFPVSNESDNAQELITPPKKDIEQESESDSYSWSMSELPGYQSESEFPKNEPEILSSKSGPEVNNSILTSNKRFKTTNKSFRSMVFGRSSNVVIYTLLIFLFLSSSTFFSVLYYQDQSFKLEQSMHKYRIAETPVVKVKTQSKEIVEDASGNAIPEKINEDLNNELASESFFESGQLQQDGNVSKPDNEKGELKKTLKSSVVAKQGRVKEPIIAPQTLQLNVKTMPYESSLQEAYQALYEEDYVTAIQAFNHVLEEDAENIKALNGLGAAYAQMNREDKALETYYRVLQLEPENLQAFEAVISLMGDELSGAEWRNEIHRVLQEHPNSAILNYALGNLYARERDWEKAQSYYFESYVLEEENSDSLVNLAVSLDHLGKYQLAEKYYTLALVYADAETTNFNPEQIKLRLATIKQFIGQEDL